MPPHRSKPPQPPLPTGFLLLGMLLVLVGVGCTVIVAEPRVDLLGRAASGSIALASLVLVEALWYVRPWVARAADAWAAACVGVVLLAGVVGASGGLGFGELFAITAFTLCFVMFPCALVRWYVRDRARKLGLAPRVVAPAAAPVAVPVPRP
jgi:hypothetical protein